MSASDTATSPVPGAPPARPTLLEPVPGERWRILRSRIWTGVCVACAGIVLLPLFSILIYVITRGASGLSVAFFTHLPVPVGDPGGGMGNAVVGSLILIGLASLFGLPVGILAGVYLSEVGRRGRVASAVRFIADVMSGLPSITIGVFVYALMVVTMKRFSALAGGVALAIVMVPTITRTTEELLRLVPAHLREASLALGVPQWRTTLFVVLRTAAPGIATGVMLAVARISGETAPLIFTAFNNRFWSFALDRPMASMPVQILAYATSPYKEWQDQAWTGAMVLVVLILFLNLTARVIAARSMGAAR